MKKSRSAEVCGEEESGGGKRFLGPCVNSETSQADQSPEPWTNEEHGEYLRAMEHRAAEKVKQRMGSGGTSPQHWDPWSYRPYSHVAAASTRLTGHLQAGYVRDGLLWTASSCSSSWSSSSSEASYDSHCVGRFECNASGVAAATGCTVENTPHSMKERAQEARYLSTSCKSDGMEVHKLQDHYPLPMYLPWSSVAEQASPECSESSHVTSQLAETTWSDKSHHQRRKRWSKETHPDKDAELADHEGKKSSGFKRWCSGLRGVTAPGVTTHPPDVAGARAGRDLPGALIRSDSQGSQQSTVVNADAE